MAGARYAIPDEPSPGPMQRWAVDPFWPLFAQMLGGSWIALPWFVFNGLAIGTATRRQEWMLAAASVAGSALFVAALFAYAGQVAPDRTTLRLLMLPLLALKLGIAYLLYLHQSRSFELWRHFGGAPRNGMVLVFLAALVRGTVLASLWMPLRLVLE